jgi:hypothetical protein
LSPFAKLFLNHENFQNSTFTCEVQELIFSPMKKIILTIAVAVLGTSSFGADAAPKKTVAKTKPPKVEAPKVVTETEIVEVLKGNGPEAVVGKMVTVHYTGKLTNGTKFDSSLDRNSPFTFQLGSEQVIPGWEKGVAGMKVGGKRKLTIPSKDGYGERGAPPVIPPNSTLVFDVELLDVK